MPRKELQGSCRCISGASGARFSLLPAGKRNRQLRESRARIPVKIASKRARPKRTPCDPACRSSLKFWVREWRSVGQPERRRCLAAPVIRDYCDRRNPATFMEARYQHRERSPAAHRRQFCLRSGREHLGPDLLPGFQRNRVALSGWLSSIVGTASASTCLRLRVHRQFVPVRTCSSLPALIIFRILQGPVRRSSNERAGDSGGHVPAGKTGHGIRGLRNRSGHGRQSDRPWVAGLLTLPPGGGSSLSTFLWASCRYC